MAVKRYVRRKEVEAIQYNGRNMNKIERWIDNSPYPVKDINKWSLRVGDYVVLENDEFRPCDKNLFEQTFKKIKKPLFFWFMWNY